MRMRRTHLASVLLAMIVALTGIEAPGHAHSETVDGWHAASPEACGHQAGPASCSICRLAHERSIATAAPHDTARPDLVTEDRIPSCEAPVLAAPVPSRPSRAPPQPPSC